MIFSKKLIWVFLLFDDDKSQRKNKMPYEVRYYYPNGTYQNITPYGTISDGYKNDFTFDTYEQAEKVVDGEERLTIVEVDDDDVLECCRCGIVIIRDTTRHDESILINDGEDVVCCDCKTDEDYE